MKLLILICLLLLTSLCPAKPSAGLEDYLVLSATINGKSVHLALDTGAEVSCLFSPAAKRLGLSITPPPKDIQTTPGKVLFNLSEPCTFSLDALPGKYTIRFPVLDLPPEAASTSLDGLIGWGPMKYNILQIEAETKHLTGLKKLPNDIGNWSKWPIFNFPQMSVLLIHATDSAGQNGTIMIDTGSPDGVSLNARRWDDWCRLQNHRPMTLMASFTPSVGLQVYQECWADRLPIGSFEISDVPVSKIAPLWEDVIPNFQATLGLFALTRLHIIIDGPGGYVYTRKMETAAAAYQYNRMAAVFVPQSTQSIQLTAHVVENGPAYEAGIRNGDILLKIDNLDVTKWQTDPAVLPLSRFWEMPAGTKLQLTLSRDNKPFTSTVELKEIFPLQTHEPQSEPSRMQDSKD